MLLRDIIKMNSINDGTRTLFESCVALPEVEEALKDWKKIENKNSVLIGVVAVGFYCRPRTTFDVDILFLTKDDIPTSVSNFKRTRPRTFQHNKTHVEVEVISPESINTDVSLVNKVFSTSVLSDGIKIASPSGLVALKLGRMKRHDEGDIWDLIETNKVDLTGCPISKKELEIYNQILAKVKK